MSLALLLAAAVAAAAQPTISREQVEADWLRQNELRQQPTAGQTGAAAVRPEDDARGGCDGVKDGKWGFHTADELNPWWRVDLGQPTPIDRLLVFNRCDTCAGRIARLMVLVSDDDKTWKQVFQNSGAVFYGYTDKKPLQVKLGGVKARFVRLQLPGKSYFHLDEVEIYAVGDSKNVALGRPATQSSVSTWSVAHHTVNTAKNVQASGGTRPASGCPVPNALAIDRAVQRGLRLAEDLGRRGVSVDAEVRTLQQAAERLKRFSGDESEAVRRAIYFDVRRAVRDMALRNPLLDFDAILFVKQVPPRFPHMSDQFYGWWSRPGGGVFVLEGFKTQEPRLRCLTADMAEGSFSRPDLSYDGKRVLFAYCKYDPRVPEERNKAEKSNLPEDAFYHVFEMNIDGTGRRQLTHGRYDDFNAIYLPDGDIAFLSTRKGIPLQCTKANTVATTRADLPDSYVRCGGDNYRPVPVFTLHAMSPDGSNPRPISAFENFEWTPSVANDGRILYTRWDYIDRFNGHFFSLWSTNPDGTDPQLVYGNYTVRPQVKVEARAVPGSQKIVMTASAHHSNLGGSIVLLDRGRGTEDSAPIVRLTPEVPFPETEQNIGMYYANPYPLSEEHFLVAWSDRHLPPHCRVDNTDQNPVNACGLYLYDAFGNLNLIYRDPTISSGHPMPVRSRPRPPAFASTVQWDGRQEGYFLLKDVYAGMPGVPQGTVKRLRVIGVPPKVQPHMNRPSLGISSEEPGKFVLGTVPVEADGSAYFRVPSGVSVMFQALDEQGLAVQTMRSLTYVQPQQTLSCIGCHESREAAPGTSAMPLAVSREPSKLTPGPAGSWPLRFDRLVQPVLDRACVSCHRPGGSDAKAAKLDLTPPKAYDSLLNFDNKDLHRLAYERDRSLPGEMPARKSRLLSILTAGQGHYGVRLDADGFQRLVTWMDLYAQRLGHYSPEQAAELERLRQRLAPMIEGK
jgi:hypothetical protein